jgi:Na+/pantothenate symporter
VLLHLEQRGPVRPAGKKVWLAQIVASLIVIVSFTMDVVPRLSDNGALLAQWTPTSYRWCMLVCGQALAIGTFISWAWRASSSSPSGVG